MVLILKIGISQSTNCDNSVAFPKLAHLQLDESVAYLKSMILLHTVQYFIRINKVCPCQTTLSLEKQLNYKREVGIN